MIITPIKTLICASALLCAGFLSSPLEAKCRVSLGINLFPPVVRPCPVVVMPPPPCRGVIVRETCPVYRPQLATMLANRPTNYDRYCMPGHPCYRGRTEVIERLDVYDCPPPSCEVTCLPTVNATYGDGELVQLSDGSLWGIAGYENRKSKLWRQGESIQVCRSGNKAYPFILTNLNYNESVVAVLKTAN